MDGISMMEQFIRIHQSFSLAGSRAWSKDELTVQIGSLLFWQYRIQIGLSRIYTGLLQAQMSAIYNCWAQSECSRLQHFTSHRTVLNQLVKANNVNWLNDDRRLISTIQSRHSCLHSILYTCWNITIFKQSLKIEIILWKFTFITLHNINKKGN